MSASYRTVSWNPEKRRYDTVAGGLLVIFLTTAIGLQAWLRPELTIETLLIRALGAAALTLLQIILCIGPATRFMPGLLPLLYNRRHLGVMMFTLALAHGAFSIVYSPLFGSRRDTVSTCQFSSSTFSASPR